MTKRFQVKATGLERDLREFEYFLNESTDKYFFKVNCISKKYEHQNSRDSENEFEITFDGSLLEKA